MKKIKKSLLTVAASTALLAGSAQATIVEVEVSNLFADGGLALTPVWVGFHDGTFDSFDLGSSASASVQALAEGGDISGITADFTASNVNGQQGAVFAPEGFGGAPVFEPGETATSATFDINATDNGYFSFLSMLIPTNDAFIGNDNATAYSLFDMDDNFVGLDILVLGSNVWDSGTKLNTGFGSPFLVGANGEARQDENGVVAQHTGLTVLDGGLAIFGGSTPAGYTIDQAAADFTAQGFEVARITVNQVPVPASAGLFSIGMVALAGFKRRKIQVKT
jgi:hypothetical protein